MVKRKTMVSKSTANLFIRLRNDLADLDASYLVGKINRTRYLKERNRLRKKFESMKRSLK